MERRPLGAGRSSADTLLAIAPSLAVGEADQPTEFAIAPGVEAPPGYQIDPERNRNDTGRHRYATSAREYNTCCSWSLSVFRKQPTYHHAGDREHKAPHHAANESAEKPLVRSD